MNDQCFYFLLRSMDEIYDALAGRIVPTAAVATDSNYKFVLVYSIWKIVPCLF